MTARKTLTIIPTLLSIIMLSLAGCGGGKEDDHAGPTVDISGFWNGRWESADNSGAFNFIIAQNGNELTGINTRLGEFTGNVQGNTMYIDGTDLYGIIINGVNISGVYTGNLGEIVTFEIVKSSTPDFVE